MGWNELKIGKHGRDKALGLIALVAVITFFTWPGVGLILIAPFAGWAYWCGHMEETERRLREDRERRERYQQEQRERGDPGR